MSYHALFSEDYKQTSKKPFQTVIGRQPDDKNQMKTS